MVKAPSCNLITYMLLGVGLLGILLGLRELKVQTLAGSLIFFGWLVSPYLALVIAAKHQCKKHPLGYVILVLTVVMISIGSMVDIVLLHPDAQGGIAILIIPVMQAISIGLGIAILAFWSGRDS